MKRTTVPICRQLLKWPNPSLKESPAGSIVLKSLNLSSETNIELTDLTHEGFMDDITTVSPIVESTYQLRIKYTNENRSLNLNFPGSKTVLDIKNDLNAVLKLPVSIYLLSFKLCFSKPDDKIIIIGSISTVEWLACKCTK